MKRRKYPGYRSHKPYLRNPHLDPCNSLPVSSPISQSCPSSFALLPSLGFRFPSSPLNSFTRQISLSSPLFEFSLITPTFPSSPYFPLPRFRLVRAPSAHFDPFCFLRSKQLALTTL
ncbi:hypothetical protein V2J09_007937 [Rumex salicifolius]